MKDIPFFQVAQFIHTALPKRIMTTPYSHHPTLPVLDASPNEEEVENRAQLVKRYNCLVGEPGKITRTIQKQFLTGFMNKDEVESLRSMYKCVISAMESAIERQGSRNPRL